MAGFRNTNGTGSRGPTPLAGAALGCVLLLAGCTSVPDALNPAEWYKSSMDYFSGDDTEGQAARQSNGEEEKPSDLKADRGKAPPGADKPFPNLASVPKGLSADRSERKYASSVSRQGEAKNVLTEEPPEKKPAPPAAPEVAETPPPPKAAPAPAVTAKEPESAPQQKSMPQSESKQMAEAPVRLRPPPAREKAPTPSASAPEAPKLTPPSENGQQAAARPSMKSEPSLNYDPYSTVVVTSSGMEMGDRAQGRAQGNAPSPAPSTPVLPSRSLSELTGNGASQPRTAPPRYSAAPGSGSQSSQGMVKVATILFDNGSSRVSDRGRRVLRDVAQLQRESGGRPVLIVGHASSRTRNMSPVRHKNVNHQVSKSRAQAVAQTLRRYGVSRGAMEVRAVGDARPIYYEVMPSGEAGNRRADVYINY